jgi:hypothetical protein
MYAQVRQTSCKLASKGFLGDYSFSKATKPESEHNRGRTAQDNLVRQEETDKTPLAIRTRS